MLRVEQRLQLPVASTAGSNMNDNLDNNATSNMDEVGLGAAPNKRADDDAGKNTMLKKKKKKTNANAAVFLT